MAASIRSRPSSLLRSSALHPASTRLLLQSSIPSSSSCYLSRCQSQPFSVSNPARRSAIGQQQLMTGQPKAPAQMSMKNRMKDAFANVRKDGIPDDVGLLPGTFVRPVWANMLSIFSNPKGRLRLEWAWLKSRVVDFSSVVSFYKIISKPRKPMALRERKKTALKLHSEMYTAFAEGNINQLDKICCAGLKDDLRLRIARRPRTAQKLTWTLHKYTKFPYTPTFSGARIVADRAAALPGGMGGSMGVRQTVVRIKSTQSTIKPTGNNKTKGGDQQQQQQQQPSAEDQQQMEAVKKDCVEYLVLQKLTFQGEEGPWKVWGLADETTIESMDEDPVFSDKLSVKEKYNMIKKSSGQ
ncbi:hypothetical protein AJ80_01641 [Polytolypa hystricis UAMH7299]|uniref:Tim44-like domain-containing protein n=1 Tax=Polytolypa hystricis (strain UAMH7299) TaxID=1447883 RepID=A0A2B7YZD4_POLH7|nr:hypothetical protein AJ80_01641 [Polytolypa hystricis UAMH7299]